MAKQVIAITRQLREITGDAVIAPMVSLLVHLGGEVEVRMTRPEPGTGRGVYRLPEDSLTNRRAVLALDLFEACDDQTPLPPPAWRYLVINLVSLLRDQIQDAETRGARWSSGPVDDQSVVTDIAHHLGAYIERAYAPAQQPARAAGGVGGESANKRIALAQRRAATLIERASQLDSKALSNASDALNAALTTADPGRHWSRKERILQLESAIRKRLEKQSQAVTPERKAHSIASLFFSILFGGNDQRATETLAAGLMAHFEQRGVPDASEARKTLQLAARLANVSTRGWYNFESEKRRRARTRS